MAMRKKIIWLCSWYPNELDRYTGDFIQRQAQAASIYADIEVVHVVDANEDKCNVVNLNPFLRETIYYIKAWNKISRYKDFFQIHESFISDYFSRKGKPDLIHVHIPIKSGLIALRWKRIYKLPFIVTEHYGIYNHEVEDRFSQRNYFFKYFTRRILQQASAFLPVSESLGKDVNEHVCSKEFQVVPNVVDSTLFYWKEMNHPQHPFRFIHVSNGASIKNLEGILTAVELLSKQRSDFAVYFIGNTNKRHLKSAKEKKLNNKLVYFLPEMSYAEVAVQVQQSDAGLLFSFNETQSCAVLEWLCSGLPVIATNVGGVKELITFHNGLIVESSNIEQLINAMETMIDGKMKFDHQLIAAHAKLKYSYDAVGKTLALVYNKIV
jgi:glycosyltransferase involved in cell wall biosynthesis